ncbi:hypothetical protein [Pyxidicoccus trucidator]|uniref:hypothetical protein n=1 Tax=Pyxidicoccus trucidator TaxID=2709662 RepID=UPI0013D99BD3|nr:hypothetical protein [Pyxidicoccus trucidator]
MLRGAPSQSVGPAFEDFYVVNLTGVARTPGYTLTGTPHLLPPNPLPAATTARFLLTAPTPPVTQTYYYTNNAAAPASGKTCIWQLLVSVTGGLCSAQLNWGSYGGAVCLTDGTQSFIDPNTCQSQIATSIQ